MSEMLPPEMIFYIMEFMDIKTYMAFIQTCSSYYNMHQKKELVEILKQKYNKYDGIVIINNIIYHIACKGRYKNPRIYCNNCNITISIKYMHRHLKKCVDHILFGVNEIKLYSPFDKVLAYCCQKNKYVYNLKYHMEKCLLKEVKCRAPNCGKWIVKKEMDAHYNKCDKNCWQCKYCYKHIQVLQYYTHDIQCFKNKQRQDKIIKYLLIGAFCATIIMLEIMIKH
jgi:hypothetical protein